MDYHKFTREPPSLTAEFMIFLHRKSEVFNIVAGDFPVSLCKEASKKQRNEMSLTKASYTYGEVDFVSLGEIFEIIKTAHGIIPEGGVFYDLGSGSGKGVISAALLHSFHKCVGIEILQSLYDISMQMALNYEQLRLHILEENRDIWPSLPDVEFINADMFSTDWSDASFIFANSTCFDQKMMDAISSRSIKPGAWAVTLTKPLEGSKWKIIQSFRKSMSWGDATVYIHLRTE